MLATAVARAEASLKAAAAAVAARRRADDAARQAAATEAAADEAAGRARVRRGEADELRRTSGADVDAVLARQKELQQELAAGATEQKQLADERDAARDRLSQARTRLEGTEQARIDAEDERAVALRRLAAVAATELASVALGVVDSERDLTQVTAGVAFARGTAERLADVVVDERARDDATNRLHSAYTDLRSRLAADFDPHLDAHDDLLVCVARLGGELVGAVDLDAALTAQIERRRQTLDDTERELIERHLLTEVGTHLGERVHGAWDLVRRMNTQLASRPTRSGVTLHLSWEPHPDSGAGAPEALRLLRQDVNLLDAHGRERLAVFLAERVRAGRDNAEGSDVVERLTAALDYRRWHRFVVHRKGAGGTERFTARSQAVGSGGEQAKLAHLPLFAAVAGYYSSASPTAPHLLVLDEAFAGIDEDQRADCMGMLVDLDLDTVLANFGEWACYPEIPSVAVYHLERTPGRLGVAALRFVWDGAGFREDDPFLDERSSPSVGMFAPDS
jgi:hypothetical protein